MCDYNESKRSDQPVISTILGDVFCSKSCTVHYIINVISKAGADVVRAITSTKRKSVILLQPIAKKQKSYIKDSTHFINFIENTTLPDNAILVSLDVCSLYTNIPQEEGINIVCQYYEEHYQSKQPIPATHLGEFMRLILAMGTKMAVAFAVIFMAHIE